MFLHYLLHETILKKTIVYYGVSKLQPYTMKSDHDFAFYLSRQRLLLGRTYPYQLMPRPCLVRDGLFRDAPSRLPLADDGDRYAGWREGWRG